MIKFRLFVFHKNISTIQNVVHDGEDVLGLLRRQFLEFLHQLFGDAGVFQLLVKEFILDGCQNIRKYRKIPS